MPIRLWEEEGRPQGRARENWLDAEAQLRAKHAISRKPITLCEFSVTVLRVSDEQPHMRLVCPVRHKGVDVTFFAVCGSSNPETAYSALGIPLNALAHDSRSTLVEVLTATALVDRIARLAEWIASEDRPCAPFLETNPSGGPTGLTPPYIGALLKPAVHKTMIAEIDSVISKYPSANFIAFDLTEVSLESPIKLKGILKAVVGSALMYAALIVGDVTKGAAEKAGEEIVVAAQNWCNREETARKLAASMAAGDIKVTQQCLAIVGHNPGPIDGSLGPLTRAALQNFCQKEHILYEGPTSKGMVKRLARQAVDRSFGKIALNHKTSEVI